MSSNRNLKRKRKINHIEKESVSVSLKTKNVKTLKKFKKQCTKVKIKPPIGEVGAIYSDGAFNKHTEPFAWASVVDSNGQDLICKYISLSKVDETATNRDIERDIKTDKPNKKDSFSLEEKQLPINGKLTSRFIAIVKFEAVTQQNNGAELIAFIIALRLAKLDKNITKIYTDSQLIEKWWSQGHVNSTTWKEMDPLKQQYIVESQQLRQQFEQRGGKIEYVSGDYNLADLGYHVTQPTTSKKRKEAPTEENTILPSKKMATNLSSNK